MEWELGVEYRKPLVCKVYAVLSKMEMNPWDGLECVLRLTLSEILKSPITTTHDCCLSSEGSWYLSKILDSALYVVLWTTLFAAQGYKILSRPGHGSLSTS
jgi:hypothetical protein